VIEFQLKGILAFLITTSFKSSNLAQNCTMALTNNDVLKKIRVALQLRDDDIVEILGLVDYKIGKSELGAFFRKEGHPKYMELQDQILRNFLNGLVIYKRGPIAHPSEKKGGAPKPLRDSSNKRSMQNKSSDKKGPVFKKKK